MLLFRKRHPWAPAAACLALALTLAPAPGAGEARADQRSRRTPVVEAVQKVQPSVVSITSEKRAASPSRWPFSHEENQRPRVSGMGTGVLVDGRGYILTCQHVVDKVEGIEVHLADGSVLPARVLQQDPKMDLAILKVDAGRPLPAIVMGSSADLMLGEDVITIGNAYGYENTISVGIISWLGRNITLSDEQVYHNLIQTDACINPGNSGGPLINIDGELIGINVAVRAGAQGLGFALPIDDVKKVAAEMMSTRQLAATWHGLQTGEARDGEGRALVVSAVQPGSPAESAGLRPGDRLVRVGELAVTNPLDVERALLDVRPGQSAEVVVRRQGKEQALPLTVQALPRATPDAAEQVFRTLGVRTVPVAREYVANLSPSFRKFNGGLYIQSVSPNSPAARAAIQKGDILVGLNANGRDLETVRPEHVLLILGQADPARPDALQYYAVRQHQFVQGVLRLYDAPAVGLRR